MGSANNDLYSLFLLCIHRNCLKTTTKKRGGRGVGSRHRLSPLKFERKVSETKVEGEKERLSLVSLHSFCLFSPCTWTFPHAHGLFPTQADMSSPLISCHMCINIQGLIYQVFLCVENIKRCCCFSGNLMSQSGQLCSRFLQILPPSNSIFG